MKTLITSIAALVLFTGIANAAETTTNTASAENKSNSLGTLSSRSLAAIIEENVTLRLKVEEMTEVSDNLQSKLDFSSMMQTTLNTLKDEEIKEVVDNKNSQLDYARMMNSTLLNLNAVLYNSK